MSGHLDRKHAPATLAESIPKACSVRDVCRLLNISRHTLHRYLQRHEIPLVRIDLPGQLRFTGKSVEAILAGRWARERRAS